MRGLKEVIRKKLRELFLTVFPRIPPCVLPQEDILREKYKILYGKHNFDDEIEELQILTGEKYAAILVLLAVLTASSIAFGLLCSREITEINRPEYGQPDEVVSATVELKANRSETSQDVRLRVKAVQLSQAEKKARLQSCAAKLPERILGENESLRHVESDLSLIGFDEASGVQIMWSSSDTDIIGTDGTVDNLWDVPKGAEYSRDIILTADLSIEGMDIQREYEVRVLPCEDEQDAIAIMQDRARQAQETINLSTGESTVALPNSLGPGTEARWKEKRGSFDMRIAVAAIMLILLVYKRRYALLDRRIREKRESVIRDFPEFADKLILLLSAGMVASAALMKIPQDYERYRKSGPSKPLYEELLAASKRVRQTNTSFTDELLSLASRLGVRELLRMSTIIAENISKGSTLAEKLQAEGELLWQGRKKRAEELSRLADTKLILPLLLLLVALVAVTVTPAWMSM